METTKKTNKMLAVSAALLAGLLVALLLPIGARAEVLQSDTEAVVSFESGGLALIDVPNLDFGKKDISPTTEVYEAEAVSSDLVISDLRGNNAGWKLMVSLTPFNFGTAGSGDETLQGAFITVASQNVVGAADNVAASPQAIEPVVLNSDNASVPALVASAGTGMGRWDVAWTNANTTLTVLPGTAREGASYATINWSLEDTP